MRHVHRTPLAITDPDTGRTYPVPQGGAGDGEGSDGDGGGDGDGDTTGEKPAGGAAKDESDTTDEDGEGAGSKAAVLADLATERRKRQAAEKERDELREQYETEDEKRQREAAELQSQVKLAEQGIRAYRTAAVETAAREAGFVDPADAAAFLDLDSIQVSEDGVDREKATELVADLADRKPHLVQRQDRPGAPRGGGDHNDGGGGDTSDDPNRTFSDVLRRQLAGRS